MPNCYEYPAITSQHFNSNSTVPLFIKMRYLILQKKLLIYVYEVLKDKNPYSDIKYFSFIIIPS